MIRRPPRPTLFPYTPLSRPRPGLPLLALLAGAAVPAAAQAPTLTITLQSETPRIQTTQLLADGKFTALMRSGFPLRLHYRLELWRNRATWFEDRKSVV